MERGKHVQSRESVGKVSYSVVVVIMFESCLKCSLGQECGEGGNHATIVLMMSETAFSEREGVRKEPLGLIGSRRGPCWWTLLGWWAVTLWLRIGTRGVDCSSLIRDPLSSCCVFVI